LALNCPTCAVVPVPLKVTFTVGFVESLLVIARLPLTVPTAEGWKVTAMVAKVPALIVFGVAIPLTPNPAPAIESMDTVRSVVPVFEIVKLVLPIVPTVIFPRLTLLLLTAICGAAITAVAERATTTGELPPSACIVSVPLSVPVEDGITFTLND